MDMDILQHINGTEQTAAVTCDQPPCAAAYEDRCHTGRRVYSSAWRSAQVVLFPTSLAQYEVLLVGGPPKTRHLTMISACACASCCLSTSSSV